MAPELCSKCKERPRADSTGNNPWCRECNSEYNREYRENKQKQAQNKGFAEGARAMRNYLVGQLRQMGNAPISAAETARWIEQQPSPQDQ